MDWDLQSKPLITAPGPVPDRCRPWDKEYCRDDSNHPDIYLTFSWGAIQPPGTMFRLFESAKQTLSSILRAGKGDLPIPDRNVAVGKSGTGVFMVARPHKTLFKPQPFTYNQIARAVDLLQGCGLNKGHNIEMWAFVFVGGKHVGDIYTGPYFSSLRNPSQGGREETGARDTAKE
ncbi:MAG: hypothetical protein LQ344_005677 [Seirophora lacunosa]|nr:MAG: hypothetical protein LQ344_005677 [Seirophora lacunosa]